MFEKKYLPSLLSLYINYFVHGMGAIILAQNSRFLQAQLGTDNAGISFVISALGIGRLAVLFGSGMLSDKFGRRPFVLLGTVSYLIFFVGILFAPNVPVAFALALVAGAANSFLDSGCIPAVMEILDKMTGTASVVTKLFMSMGQFTLPMIISFLVGNNIYFGYSFIICAAVLALNFLITLKIPFKNVEAASKKNDDTTEAVDHNKKQPNFWLEGLALILIGFTCTTTFYLVSQWITTYGRDVVGMEEGAAQRIMSMYSMGSIIAVLLVAMLVKSLVKPVRVILIFPGLSLIALIVLWAYPTPFIVNTMAFAIGFTAAGGVLQMTLTTMTNMFSGSKGKILGFVYTSSSIAFFVIPVITGVVSKTSVSNVILFDIFVTAIGVVLAVVVNIRYNQLQKNGTEGKELYEYS